MTQNKIIFRRFAALICSILAVCIFYPFPGLAQSQQREIIIGTGGVTGVYYSVGVAICNAVNKRIRLHGLHCSVESTAGSVENIDKIRSGAVDFGVVQSDVQFYAVKGYGPFKDAGKDTKLRAVFSLYPETFTVLARKDANIATFGDLKNKRVNIGNPGSGQRTSMDLVMLAKGWKESDFAAALELPSNEQAVALCAGRVDAIVFMVGHPNESIKNATTSCDTVLINVTGPVIQNLVEKYPYLSLAYIPGKPYDFAHRTPTFGVTATLVTSSETPNHVVKALTKIVFDGFIDFKFSHPAFFGLVPETMVSAGQTAPLHSGAASYYADQDDLSRKMRDIRSPRR